MQENETATRIQNKTWAQALHSKMCWEKESMHYEGQMFEAKECSNKSMQNEQKMSETKMTTTGPQSRFRM